MDSVFKRARTGLPPSVEDRMLIRESRAASSEAKVTNLKFHEKRAYLSQITGELTMCCSFRFDSRQHFHNWLQPASL